MGKRVKKKAAARTALKDKDKEKRVSSEKTVSVSVSQEHNQAAAVADGPVTPKKTKVCVHLDKAIDLAVVSSKLQSAPSTACEYCRQGKSKGKHAKKKSASDSTKATWICLQCAHFSCGPVGLPTNPQSHALRHARQTRHPLVIQADNPHLRWCFSCSTLLPVHKAAEDDTPREREKEKDVLVDIVKLLKKQSSKVPSFDVEDIWFGSGSATASPSPSASVLTQVKAETKGVDVPNGKDFYAVRGLSNLGNTCFFNSVMQNLLAMDVLRDYLLHFEESIGPLTSAFKKIFVETCPGSGLRNVLNPKPLFGCICAKAPQFRGYQQQDSHELLRYLLDGLSSEFLQARKSASTLNGGSLPVSATYVDAVFGGQTSSTVCCLECGHSSVVYEPFLDLSLPVPTKKSPLKKAQPVPRTKKTKLPPKRGGRTRPKLNKNGVLGPVHNGNTSTSMESFSGIYSGDMGSAANGSDTSFLTESSSGLKGDSLSCAPSADLAEPSNGDHRNVLVTQDSNSPQQDYGGAKVPQASVQDADGMSWMDYVEPSSRSEGAKEADSFAWLDYVEPVSLLDDPNLAVADEDFSVFQDLGSLDGNRDVVSIQDTAKESVEAGLSHVSRINGDYHDVVTLPDTVKPGDEVSSHLENVNLKSDSTIDDWGDERPVLVQDNEILLLPYKEDGPMEGEGMNIDADISSSTVVDGEDTMGFDGLGDLFNEPEAVETGVNDVPVSESLGNGFLVGNNTESDPDEVDDTDSPVSVGSCLAHFMKPECLSGEHAWHCENCSKLLKEERERMRKNQRKSALIHTNMLSDVCLSSEVVQAKEHSFLESSNSLLTTHNNGSCGTDENLKKLENRSSNGFCQNSPPDEEERLVRETAHLTVSGPVCFGPSDETNLYGKIVDSHVFERPSRLSEEHGLGEDEKEEVDLKCVKVMRDATKRLLISKTPPVLTIHLKRFGQDARGRLSKLNGHVVFKEFLDLGPYVDCRSTERDKCLYHLVGVVEHSGSMRGGHYVAYVRGGDRRRGRSEVENTQDHSVWYHASDAYVRKATLEEVLGCEAYILFYEKVKP